MKTLHLSMIIFSFALVPILFNVAFGSEQCPASGYIHYGPSRQSIPCYLVFPEYNSTVEEQSKTINMTMFNNPAFCNQHFDHGPTLAETIGKKQCEDQTYQVEYKGAKIIVTNIINKTTFRIGENITVIPELTNLGDRNVTVGYCGPLFVTLTVDHLGQIVWPRYSWACPLISHGMTLVPNAPSTSDDRYGQTLTLHNPGEYAIISIASFGDISNATVLWSKPIQITVVPEFPFAIPVMLIGLVSVIGFYRMKFRK